MLTSAQLSYTKNLLKKSKEKRHKTRRMPRREKAWRLTSSRTWKLTKLTKLTSKSSKKFLRAKVWSREFNIEELFKTVFQVRDQQLPKVRYSWERMLLPKILTMIKRMMILDSTAFIIQSVKLLEVYKWWLLTRKKMLQESELRLLMQRPRLDTIT